MPRKKTIRKNNKKQSRHVKAVRRKKPVRKKRFRGKDDAVEITAVELRGLGAPSGGQSGDIQGLSRLQIGNSESVEELVEEGQDREAEMVSAVENVPDADAPVLPRKKGEAEAEEFPEEEEVPPEYTGK
jgi:phage tail tape-measure protein